MDVAGASSTHIEDEESDRVPLCGHDYDYDSDDESRVLDARTAAAAAPAAAATAAAVAEDDNDHDEDDDIGNEDVYCLCLIPSVLARFCPHSHVVIFCS